MLVGTFLAFDKHMNLVLSDTEEFRRIKPKKAGEPEREHRRALGLVLLRGDSIIHMSAEAQPSKPTRRIGETEGKGKAQAMGRGVAIAPVGQAPAGLAGPGRGVGAPGVSNMLPTGKPLASAPTKPPGMGPSAPMPHPPGMAPMGRGMPMPPGMRPPVPAPIPSSQPPPPGMGLGVPPGMRPPPPPQAGLPSALRPPNMNQK